MDILTMDMIMNKKRYPLDIMLAPTFHKAVPLHTLYFFVMSDRFDVLNHISWQHILPHKFVSKYCDMT